MVHCIIPGVTGYNFHKIVFLSLKIVFVLANSVDPDEMLHYHLGLHYLSKYTIYNLSIESVRISILHCKQRCGNSKILYWPKDK